MKYSVVLFDLDGTLLNTLDDIRDALNRALKKHGMPPRTPEEVRQFVGNGSARLIKLAVPAECGREEADSVLKDYRADYDTHCDVKTRPYDGVTEAMKQLKKRGCKLAVVSNKPDAAVRSLAEAHFPGLLESAVGEGNGVRRKPAPDTVLAALANMGAKAEDAVYVGDSEVDVATAKNAGLDCVSVCWGFRDRETLIAAGAEKIIAAPCELTDIVER